MISDKYRYNEWIHSGVDFSDAQEVEIYDSYMQKMRNIIPEVEKVKTEIKLGPNDIVLDIGTGTGEMAIGLAKYCQKVLAIDVSKAMIDYALQKARKRGVENIDCKQAGFLTFACPPESLTAVISQFALHHLPDFWKAVAIKRIYNSLKPGGKFYLQDTVLPSAVADYELFFNDTISMIESAGGDKVARDAEKTIRDEFMTLDWIMTGILERVGFQMVTADYARPFIATYLCEK